MPELLTQKEYVALAAEISLPVNAYINGKFTKAKSGKTMDSFNPATGQMLGQVAACSAADVDLAVTKAAEVFERGEWSRMHPSERKQVMIQLCKLMERDRHQLAVLESVEYGILVRCR